MAINPMRSAKRRGYKTITPSELARRNAARKLAEFHEKNRWYRRYGRAAKTAAARSGSVAKARGGWIKTHSGWIKPTSKRAYGGAKRAWRHRPKGRRRRKKSGFSLFG
jgi:hypothetical protein